MQKEPHRAEIKRKLLEAAFAKAFHELRNRIAIFVELPLESFSKPQLKEKLAEIGRIAGADSGEKGDGR